MPSPRPSADAAPPPAPSGLRCYQARLKAETLDAIRAGKRAILIQLPTGGGKTALFADIARGAWMRANTALIGVHRRELLRQASGRLAGLGVPHGLLAAGEPRTDAPVQVASIQTIARDLAALPPFGLIVLDECHHATAGQWRALLAAQPDALVLGFTATPELLSGQGLGRETGGVFDHLVQGPSPAWLIERGFLSGYRAFRPDTRLDLSGVRSKRGDFDAGGLASAVERSSIVGDVVAAYAKHAPGLPAIAFTISIREAEATAAAFRAAGWRAVAASGRQPATERDAAIAGLETGAVQVLCSCDLVSEGLDIPSVGAVLLLRPTQSLGLYLQQVGRGLRPAPGKDRLVILDCVGNIARHGLPDADRVWSLEGRRARERYGGTPAVARCPECLAVQRPAATCAECGAILRQAAARRDIERVDGELSEIDQAAERERLRRLREAPLASLLRRDMSYRELDEIRQARGFARGWTFHKLRELSPRRLAYLRGRG